MSRVAVTADVRLHGDSVGLLTFDRGGSAFRYTADLSDPRRAVLGQMFEDDPRRVCRARIGVPAWFENLLPEGELRKQVVRELGGGNIGNFTLLLRLGAVLPGAVSVHASQEPDDDPHVQGDEPPEYPLRHSLAGVQLKYSFGGDRLTTRVSGAGSWWIVKLPDHALRDLVLNEYLTMRWLAASRFEVPNVDVVPAGSIAGLPGGLVDPADLVYIIERFDRTVDGPVHVEDFAQIANVEPRYKYSESGATYDSLGEAISRTLGSAGYVDYVRRLVAMLVTGNVDAHLKNWAFIYRDRRTPALAPIYDFHSLTVYSTFRYTPLALSLNGEKGPNVIRLDDFRRLADYCGEDDAMTTEAVVTTINDLRTGWSAVEKEAVARFGYLAAHYAERLRSLPICLAASD